VFGLRMPKSCPGVDASILNPRNVWQDKQAYDAAALKLRDMFREHFERQRFADFGIEAVM
jgi:phosphoenolpyruvate carboxykinase (ATP)